MSHSDLNATRPAAGQTAASVDIRTTASFPAVGDLALRGDASWHWHDPAGGLPWDRQPLKLFARIQIGLDVGSRWIKYAAVRHRPTGSSVIGAGAVPVSGEAREEMGKIRAQVAALMAARQQIDRPGARWIVGLGGVGTMVRTVEVPRMPRGELDAAVTWQAQKKFPFPLDDSHVAITYLRTPPKQPVKAVVAAALKRQVEDFLFLLSEAEIHPSALLLPAFGMAQALLSTGPIPAGEFNGVINIGAERSLFAVYRGGNLEFFRELDVGTGDVEQALAEDIAVVDRFNRPDLAQLQDLMFHRTADPAREDSAQDESALVIQDALEKLVLEIQSTLEYYAAQSGGLRINRFFLAGGGTGIARIEHHLESLLDIPVRILVPAQPGLLPAGMETDGLAHPAIWSGALGYALLPRRVPNLLPAEFLRRQEEQFRTLIWRMGTGTSLALALILSGAEYYRAERSSARLDLLHQQIAETTTRLQQIGGRNLEGTLASNQRWMAAVIRPDLSVSDFLRTVAASTPYTIVIDRIDVIPADSGWARASLTGEVRTDHAENEVVLADFVKRLRSTGYLTDVALANYRTVRNPEYEQITFSVTCRAPLEIAR